MEATLVNGMPRLTGQSQPAGSGCGASSSAVRYDLNGNVASADDFNGSRVCSVYDSSRNMEAVRVEGVKGGDAGTNCDLVTPSNATIPSGSRKTSTEWHPDWKLPTRAAKPGQITTSVYNGQPDPLNGGALATCAPASAVLPDGKPIAVLCKQIEQSTTDTDGHLGFSASLQTNVPSRVQQWTYDQFGQVLTEQDAMNNLTRSEYYPDTSFTGADPIAVGHTMGDLMRVTNAAGKVTTYDSYDKNGSVLQSTDANGLVTGYVYDARQRLTSTSVGDQTTRYDYDAAGQLTRVTAPDGSWIGYEYDAAHRKTATKDSFGNRIELQLDNAGNVQAQNVSDPQGSLARNATHSRDALNSRAADDRPLSTPPSKNDNLRPSCSHSLAARRATSFPSWPVVLHRAAPSRSFLLLSC